MPARTPTKKTMPSKKSAAKKPARAAKSSARGSKKRVMNGDPAKASPAAKRSEGEMLREQLREREERLGVLELQVVEFQARLTTGQVEMEAARAEAATLREAAAKARAPGEKGNLRCPRCAGHMSEQLLEHVRAERCDACHGIFFDNGELENVIKHHDEQRAAGGKSWFSGIFGKKTT